MVPDSDTPDDSLVSSPHPATDDPSYHGNPTLHNPPEPSSPKPLLRRISESLESRKVLLRTWSVNNVGSQSPSLLERLGGLSVWASTPAVSSTQDNVSSTQDTPATQEQEEEERRDKPEYDVVVEEDSPDEDIPLPDPRTMSLSRKSNIVSLNSKMKRSMSSLSLFKAPRIRRKRKKGGLGKGIEPQTLSFEGEIDFDLKVLGSKGFVDLRYQDPAQVIYTEWRKSNKTTSRLNADEHYKMSQRHCKQM